MNKGKCVLHSPSRYATAPSEREAAFGGGGSDAHEVMDTAI